MHNQYDDFKKRFKFLHELNKSAMEQVLKKKKKRKKVPKITLEQ